MATRKVSGTKMFRKTKEFGRDFKKPTFPSSSPLSPATESGLCACVPDDIGHRGAPPTSEDAKARESNVPDLISATLSFRQILDSFGCELFAHAADMTWEFPFERALVRAADHAIKAWYRPFAPARPRPEPSHANVGSSEGNRKCLIHHLRPSLRVIEKLSQLTRPDMHSTNGLSAFSVSMA
jgi:hypothetical protein